MAVINPYDVQQSGYSSWQPNVAVINFNSVVMFSTMLTDSRVTLTINEFFMRSDASALKKVQSQKEFLNQMVIKVFVHSPPNSGNVSNSYTHHWYVLMISCLINYGAHKVLFHCTSRSSEADLIWNHLVFHFLCRPPFPWTELIRLVLHMEFPLCSPISCFVLL